MKHITTTIFATLISLPVHSELTGWVGSYYGPPGVSQSWSPEGAYQSHTRIETGGKTISAGSFIKTSTAQNFIYTGDLTPPVTFNSLTSLGKGVCRRDDNLSLTVKPREGYYDSGHWLYSMSNNRTTINSISWHDASPMWGLSDNSAYQTRHVTCTWSFINNEQNGTPVQYTVTTEYDYRVVPVLAIKLDKTTYDVRADLSGHWSTENIPIAVPFKGSNLYVSNLSSSDLIITGPENEVNLPGGSKVVLRRTSSETIGYTAASTFFKISGRQMTPGTQQYNLVLTVEPL